MYEIETYDYHEKMMGQLIDTYRTIHDEVKAMMKTRSVDRLIKENVFHFDNKKHIESTLCNMIQSCYDDPSVRFSGGKRSSKMKDIYESAEFQESENATFSGSPFYFCAFDPKKLPNNIVHKYWDNILTDIQLAKKSNMRSIEVMYNPHAQYRIPDSYEMTYEESCDHILYMSLIEEIYYYLITMETDYWFKENINSWVQSLSE